jgi:pyruvate ferredoxin oxidoreductase beta subunit
MSKIYNLKREVEKPPRLTGGHRLCAGCGAGVVVSGVLRALNQEDRAVVVNATSCLEVSTFMYPYTAYMDSFIHSAFENSAATCSGVEAAYNALKRRGIYPHRSSPLIIIVLLGYSYWGRLPCIRAFD